ncbi:MULTISPECIES: hypothetical protein [Hornefia]|uniref:Uncharacterized protein n=1 Tax=Hornefia porci TaxID=2652292 RepID=A0A1Q9JGH1_9FIRM|nr:MULTISPECIES: hypothetical protein [Hornefia]MDY5463202.1 hypothetical protein [Hornefia butyriciproducens]OLR55298.1 hypothetical protein BHK98_03990 [Hornefia porci]
MSVKLTEENIKTYMEKQRFVERLSDIFRDEDIMDIEKMEYTPVMVGDMEVAGEKVTITFRNKFAKVVDVTADSKMAIMSDILRRLNR